MSQCCQTNIPRAQRVRAAPLCLLASLGVIRAAPTSASLTSGLWGQAHPHTWRMAGCQQGTGAQVTCLSPPAGSWLVLRVESGVKAERGLQVSCGSELHTAISVASIG